MARDEQLRGESTGAGAETEFLDLDGDGVPDAVQTTETIEYETEGGVEVVEEIRELDSDIGSDGIPKTVTVTDTVAVDTDQDGEVDEAEVLSVTVHPDTAAESP
jgi:hypothetical protein